MRPDTLQLFYSLTSSHNVFEDSGYLARREKILSPTSSPRFHIAFRQFPWIFLFLASLNLYGSETNLRHVLQQTSTLQMCCVLADGLYFYHTVVWDVNLSRDEFCDLRDIYAKVLLLL